MNSTDQLSLRLCQRVAELRYEDLPDEVVERLKYFLVDTLGVIGGASRAPGIPELNHRLALWEKTGAATGLLGRLRLSPPSAALANAAAAHALDFDDQHDPARVHANCVILPTLLATSEDSGPHTGKDFLLALAVGTELHARLGLSCYRSLNWGWHPTSVLGSLAGAIAAAKLLHLPVEGIVNAFGMAFQQASGSTQSIMDGVLSKRLGPAFAARAAVVSAFLAADGLTGTRRTLEGDAGLISMYERGEFDVGALMDGLGSEWQVSNFSFKPYPCCRCNHTVISLGLDCFAEGIRPEDVKAVRIGLGKFNWKSVGAKYEPARNEVVHAQFNAAFSFAYALSHGTVDLTTYQRPAITDGVACALSERIDTVVDPEFEDNAVHPARVRMMFRDGTERVLFSDAMKGSPRAPMTVDEILTKFRTCLAYGLDASRADSDRLANLVFDIDKSSDAARELVDAFPSSRRDQ